MSENTLKYQTIILFPTAALLANLNRNVTNQEMELIENLERRPNTSNSTSKNSYVLNLPELQNIKNFFDDALNFYVKETLRLRVQDLSLYITQSWVNFTEKYESHQLHNHPNSFLSGVFYIQVDPINDSITFNKELNFLFSVPFTEPNMFNSNAWDYKPKNGDLLIFPSNLLHEVPIKKTDGTRISISFNTFIKGSIGSEFNLTEVQI
jgi:uncharacterized protein (TIGR02466 family)